MSNELDNLPDAFLCKISTKASKIESTLEKANRKFLNKISKTERRLYNELIKKKDSTGARNVFGDIDSVYAELERSSKQRVQEAGPKQRYYNGRLDSVYTTLRFLSAETLTKSGHSHKMKELNS
ncbi:MAG TPA: hypothetical protein VIK89_00470, partial [Cytophagaceae bacterium]